MCLKLPTPPSFASTLWKNDEAFVEKYFSTFKGFYITGDIGYKDEDGYFHMFYFILHVFAAEWLETMTSSTLLATDYRRPNWKR